jgi:hypothetical protein
LAVTDGGHAIVAALVRLLPRVPPASLARRGPSLYGECTTLLKEAPAAGQLGVARCAYVLLRLLAAADAAAAPEPARTHIIACVLVYANCACARKTDAAYMYICVYEWVCL